MSHSYICRCWDSPRLKIVHVGHTFHDGSFLKDGVHLTQGANEVIAKKLLRAVQFTDILPSTADQRPPDLKSPSQFPRLSSSRKRKGLKNDAENCLPWKKARISKNPISVSGSSAGLGGQAPGQAPGHGCAAAAQSCSPTSSAQVSTVDSHTQAACPSSHVEQSSSSVSVRTARTVPAQASVPDCTDEVSISLGIVLLKLPKTPPSLSDIEYVRSVIPDIVVEEDIVKVARFGSSVSKDGKVEFEARNLAVKDIILEFKRNTSKSTDEDIINVRILTKKTREQLNQEFTNRQLLRMIPGGENWFVSGTGKLVFKQKTSLNPSRTANKPNFKPRKTSRSTRAHTLDYHRPYYPCIGSSVNNEDSSVNNSSVNNEDSSLNNQDGSVNHEDGSVNHEDSSVNNEDSSVINGKSSVK